MQRVNEHELRNVVGGATYTFRCCNYYTNCLKKYKGGSWSKGKVKFKYSNQLTFSIKYALNKKHYYACHDYDCNNQ
ncbi:MAG: hypothetical protein IJD40_02555 [Lachnospiraceae bacterium]|nr:hypothetical protein [Lachnospiraceae bacterium]